MENRGDGNEDDQEEPGGKIRDSTGGGRGSARGAGGMS